MMRRRISFAVAMLAAGVLGAGCGGSSYSSENTSVPVSGVTIEKASTFVRVGAEEVLAATVQPPTASEKRLLWSSSNPAIVSVTAAGKIRGEAEGTATVTVTTFDGGKTARCTVTVTLKDIPVTGVTLDESAITLRTGEARMLKATIAPADAANQALTWDIQPSGIANLAATGNVATITGQKVGDATVTVTSVGNPNAKATATVKVTPVAVTGVALSQTTLALKAAAAGATDGTSAAITAAVAPTEASNKEVRWTTTDALVASLSSTSGSTVTVVAHNKGSATITATTVDGAKIATCVVTVDPPDAVNVPVQSVSVSPSTVGLEATPATTTIVRAFIQPANASNQGIYWTTTDKTVAAISPVSGGPSADSVSGSEVLVTAGKLGTTTLTAFTQEGAKQATVNVGVYMVDADIAGNLAGTFAASSKVGWFDTKMNGSTYQEVAVGKLVYRSDDSGFANASAGITIHYYAAGTEAKPGEPVSETKAYVGIPAQSMTFPPGTAASVKVSVTASAALGTPMVALIDHATKRPYGIKKMTEGPPYVFDGVPAGSQVDIIDGAANGPDLTISHVRVEPSGTAAMNLTPPPEVTGLAATVASATSLTLNWTNPTTSDFDHVEISCVSTTTVATVNVLKADPATKTFTGLTTGASYTFTVKAVDTRGNKSAGVSVAATPASVAPLLDVTIPLNVTASLTACTTNGTANGQFSTLPSGSTQPVEVAVGQLLYYGIDNAFKPGDAADKSGIMFNSYAAGSSAATVNTAQTMRSYIGIPAAKIQTGKSTVKVTVTARHYPNYPAMLALSVHGASAGTGTVFGIKAITPTMAQYIFDNVPANKQLDLFNGAADGSYMYVSAVRVE